MDIHDTLKAHFASLLKALEEEGGRERLPISDDNEKIIVCPYVHDDIFEKAKDLFKRLPSALDTAEHGKWDMSIARYSDGEWFIVYLEAKYISSKEAGIDARKRFKDLRSIHD